MGAFCARGGGGAWNFDRFLDKTTLGSKTVLSGAGHLDGLLER